MKIYQVIGHPIDCEGHSLLPKILKSYVHYIDAVRYKTDWENLWNKHTNEGDCESPCWYDFKEQLEINEIEVEEIYNELEIFQDNDN